MTICAAVVLAARLAAVWTRVIHTLTESTGGPQTIGQPGALVWNGRVFTSPGQLKAYLTSKGLSYSRWAARHPTAFGAAAPPPVKRHTTKKASKPKPKPTTPATKAPTPTEHVAAPAETATSSRSLVSVLLTALLLAGGLVLAGSALIPPRFAPVSVARFYADPGRRTVALAAAAAVLLGLGVSFYLA